MKIYLYIPILLLLSSGLDAQVILKAVDSSCKGDGKGKVTVLSVTNAVRPIKNYQWSNGDSGPNKKSIEELSAGTYTVTVTDNHNCTAVASAMVKEPSNDLKINAEFVDGVSFVCAGANVQLKTYPTGGTPPYSGSRFNSTINISSPPKPECVEIKLKDKNGCEAKEVVCFAFSLVACSSDPNDISGPIGIDEEQWVAAKDNMPFLIRFENDPKVATSPAQEVIVRLPIDPNINPFSLRLGDFGWGPYSFEVPEGSTFYQTRLDLTDSLNLFVDVTAGLDINSNEYFWIFQSIDPLTGQIPLDPQKGFLPVNDTLKGTGEGFINFNMTPKTSSVTGDSVLATASIIFDVNEAIVTNTWKNILDAFGPNTSMQTVASNPLNTNEVELTWTGVDDLGGVGMYRYQIYMSKDSADFLLLETSDSTAGTYVLEPGSNYRFFSIGIDRVGNMEAFKQSGEVSIDLADSKEIVSLGPAKIHHCFGDSLSLLWSATSIDSIQIEFSLDSGAVYQSLALVEAGMDSLSIMLDSNYITDGLVFRFTSLNDTISEESPFYQVHALPQLTITTPDTACSGEPVFLSVTGAVDYLWTGDTSLLYEASYNPIAYPVTDQMYVVQGTDAFGCVNLDSAFVETEFCTWEGGIAAFVDWTASGLKNGSTWNHAFTKLEDAISAAKTFPQIKEIWVAKGTYLPTTDNDRDVSYMLEDSMTIYGGFNGIESLRSERDWTNNQTTLSGDIGMALDSTDNSRHVISIQSNCTNCILDGFNIEFGNADQAFGYGGGLVVFGEVILENLTVQKNSAMINGSGLTNAGGTILLKNSTFQLNELNKDNVLNQSGTITIDGTVIIKK